MAATSVRTEFQFQFKSKPLLLSKDRGRSGSSSKGSFDGQVLDLGWHEPIGVEHISKVVGHCHRMCIEISPSMFHHHHHDMIFVEIIVKEKILQDLVREVNAAASLAKVKREEINDKKPRSRICPYCSSTVLLSDLVESPQIYCRYCEAIFPRSGLILYDEKDMRLCNRCGFYSKPELFCYRLNMKKRHRILCKGCEQEKARRVCCVNSLTLLGLPSAIMLMYKAHQVQDLPSLLEELDRANTFVKKCDTASVTEAMKIYKGILQSSDNGVNAGIRYNLGMAYIALGDNANAIVAFKASLEDCCNYEPAAGMLLDCYRDMGAGASPKVAELRRQFGWEGSEMNTRRSLRKVFFDIK